MTFSVQEFTSINVHLMQHGHDWYSVVGGDTLTWMLSSLKGYWIKIQEEER